MPEAINETRRRIIAATIVTLAATQVRAAAPSDTKDRGASDPFGTLKQVDAGVLNVGYVEMGPASGRPVILLHGWPYDIHSFTEVAPLLSSAGYRVIVPHLRGYGTTRFLAVDSIRNGQPAALAGLPSRRAGGSHRDDLPAGVQGSPPRS